MLRINTHIERLLSVNDCVIIPDFGGFVLQPSPAVHTKEAHTFYPPRKEIVFNPALTHNDGLVFESYMQVCRMNFEEARSAVKQEVDDLKAELDRCGKASLGRIGSFYKQKGGLLTFQPGTDTSFFCTSAYGLSAIYLPPIGARQEDARSASHTAPVPQRTSEPKRLHHPAIPLAVLRVIGLAAATIALFLFISTPVEEVNPDAYTASFFLPEIRIPEETMPSDSSALFPDLPELPVREQKQSAASPEQPVREQKQPATPPEQAKMDTDADAANPQPAVRTAVQKVEAAYYVIIGSFETENNARRFLSEIETFGLRNVGVVRYNQNIRVYADRYDNRKDAEDYLHLLRTNEKFKNAWLFIGQ
jgi:cell division septation protein DedD